MGLTARIAVMLIVAAAAPRAHALDVYFAGFAWLGDARSIATNYPYSHALEARAGTGVSPLDAALSARMRGVANDGFTLRFDELGTLGPDSPSSLALAFVLDRESVSVETLGATHKIVVELSAQALFFDFRESVVVASFPVTVAYRDVRDSKPGSADLAALVRNLYFAEQSANVINDFAKAVAGIRLNQSVTRRIQVTEVSVAPNARALLPPRLADDEAVFRNALAQAFSAFLSTNQGIPVLPYSVGYAIGNRMAGRFADGTVFDLKIPETDYAISLSLENLRRVEYEKTPVVTTYVYGAYLHARFAEPLSNTVFFDATIKNGATKIVPASQAVTDDWPAYQESLLVLMNDFTNGLNAPDAKWAGIHIEKPGVLKEMKTLQKVLQSCK